MLPARSGAMSMDGTWEFVPDPGRAFGPDRLPSGGAIQVPGAWEAQLAAPQGVVRGWYRRRFQVLSGGPDDHLVIRFDSTSLEARAWLDGHEIASGVGPLPFEIDAGPAVSGVERELTVAVDNPFNALAEFP